MNVRLLRRIQKFILDEPRRFNMGLFVENVDFLPTPERPPCGTQACIAGTAYWLTVKPTTFARALNAFMDHSIELRARKVLNLTAEQSDRLFFTDLDSRGWPKKFTLAYDNAKTPRGRARAAVRRIDHFIKTRGKE